MIRRILALVLLIILAPVAILVGISGSILILLPFVLLTLTLAAVLYFIITLGTRASPNQVVEKTILRTVGDGTFTTVRDDLLVTFYPIVLTQNYDNLDRWSVLREIDKSRDRVIRRIAAGSSAISIIGGVISIFIGTYTGFGWALAMLLVLVTILIAVSLASIRILSFRSYEHEFDSLEDLATMKGWNDGPMQNWRTIALAIVMILVILVFAKPGSRSYNTSMRLIQKNSCKKVGIDPQRWHAVEEVS